MCQKCWCRSRTNYSVGVYTVCSELSEHLGVNILFYFIVSSEINVYTKWFQSTSYWEERLIFPCWSYFSLKMCPFFLKCTRWMARKADSDQTAHFKVVWSGSILFAQACLCHTFWINILHFTKNVKPQHIVTIRSNELPARLGIEDLDLILKERLHRYGHMERANGAVRTAFDIQVDGKRGPGRPKRTWKQLTERDCREWKLSALDPHDRYTWRSGVRSAMRAASNLPLYLHVNKKIRW